MSLAGAPPQGGGDDLLAQIQMLLMQYLQQGPDTPVAPEAAALMQAIDQTGAGGGQGAPPPDMGGMPPDMGAMPPDAGGMPPDAGAIPGAPNDAPPEETPAPTSSGDSFKDARAGAKEYLKKKGSKA